MNRILLLLLFFLSLFAQYSCGGSQKSGDQSSADNDRQTQKPDNYVVFKLPAELDEVSGICFVDSQNVLAIEDEQGVLYHYNLSGENITKQQKFAGAGDFEDLAIIGDDAYVITSGGELYKITDYKSGTQNVEKIITPFNGKHNVEGLAFDRLNNRLLIAPKDEGLENSKDKQIYAFDLRAKTLATSPVFSISLVQIEKYFEGDALEESSKSFLKAIGNKNMNEVFQPSALAVHPKNNTVYILSSINNIIAVLNPEGALQTIISLKGKEFLQPEGLAFSAEGILYVSNEGKGGKANIIRINL